MLVEDPRKALEWAELGVEIGDVDGHPEVHPELLILRGEAQHYLAEYRAAEESINAGLALLPSTSKQLAIEATLTLTMIQLVQGETTQALATGQSALRQAEQTGDRLRMHKAQHNLGARTGNVWRLG